VCFALLLLTAQASLAQLVQTPRVTPQGTGYLEYLPPDYATNTSRTYPLIIFLHGAGEMGTGSASDLEKLKVGGPPKEIKNGSNMCFTVNGVQECFIVVSPQLNYGPGGWWASILEPFFNEILHGTKNYRIDPTRVYLTGLSMGGQGTYIGLGQTTDIFAAAAVISGFDNSSGCTISARKIPVWGFHGTSDGTIPYDIGLNNFNAIVNCTNPVPAAELKWTAYAGVGHNAWDNAYTTDHSVQSPLNVYEWFLTKNKGVKSNVTPTVNAGADQVLQLPATWITLAGTATDSDGTIASYAWTQVSGPTTTLTNANTASLLLPALIAGSYVFRLTATDNSGGVSSDDVNVTVDIAPTVNAGADKVLQLPANSTTIAGSATDLDGTIASYAWSKVSGPAATLANASTASLSVSALVTGSYVFRLTATDNLKAIGTDDVNVTVNAAPAAAPPVTDSNIALQKPVTTSSNQTWLGAAGVGPNAVDGNLSTRWSSGFSPSEWIAVDLGSNYSISKIKIFWEASYGVSYKVDYSPDGTNWTTIKTVTGNTSVNNELTDVGGTARFVRILGLVRAVGWAGLQYGYSIYELEVYGTYSSSSARTASTNTTAASETESDLGNLNSEEQEVSLSFLDKKYTGGKQYDVIIFNASGNKIYSGKWSNEVYHEIVRPNEFYFYQIFRDGGRIDSGKMVTTDQ